MKIIKRNGNEQEFNREKISNAINAAFKETDGKLNSNTKGISYRISKDVEKILKEVNTLDLVSADNMLITKDALEKLEEGLTYE